MACGVSASCERSEGGEDWDVFQTFHLASSRDLELINVFHKSIMCTRTYLLECYPHSYEGCRKWNEFKTYILRGKDKQIL